MFVQLSRDYLGRKAGECIDLGEDDAAALIAAGTATAVADDPIGPLLTRALDGVSGSVQSAVESALQAISLCRIWSTCALPERGGRVASTFPL
jgi:hypothetical protein